MSRIQQLEANVINKIAAGEVIERPASVVKELLENSVDALATRIEIDVEAGGTELIRVVDDGEGVHPEDLLLTVTSHATSKITTSDDLFSVQTMGFRGEALASIASVSQFRLRSRQSDSDGGWELEVRGGQNHEPTPCGCPIGTQIEVRQLFGNTPVRRNFLKTTATEFGHISEQFTRVALANPRLGMTLRHNNKVVHQLPPSDRILERLQLFFGSEISERLIWVESEMEIASPPGGSRTEAGETIRIWGYVGHPSFSKATRKGQYLFLNGRWIQDRSLQHALSEAYRGLLMVGRHPVSFLFLEMPPSLVDVNVHPCKWEVRFRDSQQLYRQLLSMIRTTFLGMELDSEFRLPGGRASSTAVDERAEQSADRPIRQLTIDDPHSSWSPRALPAVGATRAVAGSSAEAPTTGRPVAESPSRLLDAMPTLAIGTVAESDAASETDRAMGQVPVESAVAAGDENRSSTTYSSRHRAIQVHDCYLVLPSENGLQIIDQHALHERILYEYLKERVLNGELESQRLLIPITIEMSGAELSVVQDQADQLKELGFEVEEFGAGTVAVHSYPVMLRNRDVAQIVRDLCEQLAQSGRKVTRRDILDEVLQMMSCKAAIKAGQRLSVEEMDELLEQRHLVDDTHHCPHGRPTALTLSREMLDRQFGRLG